MRPDRVAALVSADGCAATPTSAEASRSRRGRSSRPTERGEGRLGRSTGGPATSDRLLEPAGRGHPLLGGLADDVVDPALDQREHGLEPDRARPAGRGSSPARTVHPRERLLERGRVHRVDAAHRLLDLATCRSWCRGRSPRRAASRWARSHGHVREQPLVGRLAEGEVEAARRRRATSSPSANAATLSGSSAALPVGTEREPDVGGGRAPRRRARRAPGRPGCRTWRRRPG